MDDLKNKLKSVICWNWVELEDIFRRINQSKKKKKTVLIHGSQTEDLVGEEDGDEESTPRW